MSYTQAITYDTSTSTRRHLCTTDIVDSIEQAAALGDREWRNLLESRWEFRSGPDSTPGEVELRGADIAGIGVHIAARVLDHASGGELLASAAVPMLVAGSGIEFEDRGERALKGVPGTWRLFRVEA